jgi:hypothetical protein
MITCGLFRKRSTMQALQRHPVGNCQSCGMGFGDLGIWIIPFSDMRGEKRSGGEREGGIGAI